MTEQASYHTKYRPQSFKTVRGQDEQLKKLESVLAKGTSQAFIFVGPSGCGKTTLARIVAKHVGCDPADVVDVDAATNSGAEETRKLQEVMAYRPIGGGEKRAIIIDEAHGLSQKSWDTLLKTIEEPSQHAFWFFCTTNPGKVPKTIMTRCVRIELLALNDRELERIVNRVCEKEGIDLDPGVKSVVINEAYGSARQALVNLAAAEHCTNRKEAARALQAVLEGDPIRELCQFLLKPGSWIKAMAILDKFPEDDRNYEGRRIIVCNYMGSVLKGAKSDDAATNVLQILEAWSTPYNPSEGAAPFLLSIGRTMFAGG
jgi:DNA polymerase-3 subunit gamma/tau